MRRAKYFTPTPYGTRGSIRIDGVLYQKHFKRGTDDTDMRQWLVDIELEHRKGEKPASGTFKADADKYLTLVSGMTSYADRARDINAWIEKFGETPRSTIKSHQITEHLQEWRKTLSASSCNSRRAALQHLWSRLDGKSARNPVRDAVKFTLPNPAPRALDYTTIRRILSKVPDGPDKARLMMIAYVGLPNAIIAQLTRESFNARRRELAVPGRKKGAGTVGRTLPLTPQGVEAVKMMIATKAWGPFPRFTLRRVFRQACIDAGVPPVRPYDLRHSFGTELYRQSGDPEAVQVLMLHASSAMTRRYTLAAVPARVKAALNGFGVARRSKRSKPKR